MLRRLLLAAAMVVVPIAAMLVPSAANAATAAACTGGVSVSQFAFSPASIPRASGSNLTLVLQNCGSQSVQGSTTEHGTYNPGQGCPVSDGPTIPFSIDPGGSFTLTTPYGDSGFAACNPTSLRVVAFINVNGVGQVATATATLQFTSCTNGIAINQFSFSPATVAVGQTSTLTLVLQNCGSQAVQGQSTWTAQFTGSGTGRPPGCPVIDPVAFSYSLAPGATATQTLGLGDPIATCLATGIAANVSVSANGVAGAATASANLVITQPVTTGTCHVTYAPNNWQGGFTANITIANNGATAINGWTLTFTFPGDQKVTAGSPWNATVSQSGANVTATNLSYNSTIAPGGSQSFGFQGTWTTSDAPPTSFSVNGVTCT
jgi:hypothetical protein